MSARAWLGGATVLVVSAITPAAAHAGEAELGVASPFVLVSNDAVKGAGVGLAVGLGYPIVRHAGSARSVVIGRVRASVLVGAGLAFTLEAGLAWRLPVGPWWEPEVSADAFTMGGALARTIDAAGNLAANPVALLLGWSPLRFRTGEGWIALASPRVGYTLGAGGYPPLALAVTLLEIGRRF